MAGAYQHLLTDFKQNHDAGSVQLTLETLQALYHYLTSKSTLSLRQLQAIFTDLSTARPSMIVMANAISQWQQQLIDKNHDKQHYLDALQNVLDRLATASQHTAQHALTLVKPGMTIISHSHSSQVLKVFQLLAQQQRPIRVLQTLSAPGNEGLLVAKQLDQWDIPVTMIADAAIGLSMADADLVLSGCDNWLQDHYFVNKTGTLLLALAAKMFNKPFWVLADSFKNSPQQHDTVLLESMPLYELHLPQGQHISGQNIYFETIPTRLIQGRIDEYGLHVNL